MMVHISIFIETWLETTHYFSIFFIDIFHRFNGFQTFSQALNWTESLTFIRLRIDKLYFTMNYSFGDISTPVSQTLYLYISMFVCTTPVKQHIITQNLTPEYPQTGKYLDHSSSQFVTLERLILFFKNLYFTYNV